MKIVMFSINPIFPKVVTGGASKHLYHIARHLGAQGHQVEVVCAQAQDAQNTFTWAENVTVSPDLPFHLPFPQPYAVSGGDLALIVERVAGALQSADRFYIHDGEFLLPDVYGDIPTVISFRDNIYPESVLGSFIGRADDVICVSDYSAAVIKATAGRFYPGLGTRLHQVNNGVDLDVFKWVDPSDLAQQLGVDPQRDIVILHPHRPEPGKGLPETIQVASRLVNRHGLTQLKVLVPEWIGGMVSSGEAQFYDEMMRLMTDLGVRDHFIFMPWMSPEQMPALYSLGAVTLCLGNIVEAFGNVAYESLACGTPSIVARVGVHRTLLPEKRIAKVDYGDLGAAVSHALRIVQGQERVSADTLAYLSEHLNFKRQVESYAGIITHCEKRRPAAFKLPEESPDRLYALAPWCYFRGGEIYHDFRGRFEPAGELAAIFQKIDRLTQTAALQSGITPELWAAWLEKTYLVPALGAGERQS